MNITEASAATKILRHLALAGDPLPDVVEEAAQLLAERAAKPLQVSPAHIRSSR